MTTRRGRRPISAIGTIAEEHTVTISLRGGQYRERWSPRRPKTLSTRGYREYGNLRARFRQQVLLSWLQALSAI